MNFERLGRTETKKMHDGQVLIIELTCRRHLETIRELVKTKKLSHVEFIASTARPQKEPSKKECRNVSGKDLTDVKK